MGVRVLRLVLVCDVPDLVLGRDRLGDSRLDAEQSKSQHVENVAEAATRRLLFQLEQRTVREVALNLLHFCDRLFAQRLLLFQ